jgi:hypothetical protein
MSAAMSRASSAKARARSASRLATPGATARCDALTAFDRDQLLTPEI